MKIRYPINIYTDNLDDTLQAMAVLLKSNDVAEVDAGAKIDDLYFVGPYNLVKDLYTTPHPEKNKSLNVLMNTAAKTSECPNTKAVAYGVFLPADYTDNYPFLMLYKRVEVLDGKPVLISENYLTPGELVIVPESSEYFAVLFYNDGERCSIPEQVRWFCWYAEEPYKLEPTVSKQAYRIDYETNNAQNRFVTAELIELEQPLLESQIFPGQLMNADHPVVHITPILSDADAETLLQELKSCKAWIRRTGENNILYTQETFDIWEYSRKECSPEIFRRLISRLDSVELFNMMGKLSGLEIGSLREVYAFRMNANEFITRHADSSLGGLLLVRFNWLLQSPAGRTFDLRFWKDEDDLACITQYRAVPNSATVFYLGDSTPHDLTPLPEHADQERYNLVITFGKNAD